MAFLKSLWLLLTNPTGWYARRLDAGFKKWQEDQARGCGAKPHGD